MNDEQVLLTEDNTDITLSIKNMTTVLKLLNETFITYIPNEKLLYAEHLEYDGSILQTNVSFLYYYKYEQYLYVT